MKTKILAISSKAPSRVQNKKGQALIESLFVLQALCVVFIFLCVAGITTWNHLCLHWITHESAICESIQDDELNCKKIASIRINNLTIGNNIFNYAKVTRPQKIEILTKLETHFAELPVQSLKARHTLKLH